MKSNSLYYTVKDIIEYIEENLKTTITLDDISNHVSISKFHLNRLFHAISNAKLIHYVKNRKLSSSINELLNTNLKISDIAHEYGFNYEQSYIRLFINTFGISPDQFRKNKPALKISEKINLDYIHEIGEKGITLVPSIVIMPEFLIAGVRSKIFTQDDSLFHRANEKGNDVYYNRRHEIQNKVNHDVYIGFVEYITEDDSYTYYTPSIQVSSPDGIPSDMVCRRIPTNRYAVFKYIGLHHARNTNISSLRGILNYIFGDWLPKSEYSHCAPYHFERIDEKVSKNDYCEVEIFVPV
jgi:AraC family transcriptional regulator